MRYLFLVGLILGGSIDAPAQTAPAPLVGAAEVTPTAALPTVEPHAAGRSILVAFALDASALAVSGLVANALITDPCEMEPCHGEEAGFTVLYAGLAAGMTVGHVYAGDARRALIGLGIRAAGMGFIIWGNGQNDGDFAIDEPGYLIGLPILLAGTAYSLVTTPRSVRDFNARPALTVAPGMRPDGVPTLTLAARF